MLCFTQKYLVVRFDSDIFKADFHVHVRSSSAYLRCVVAAQHIAALVYHQPVVRVTELRNETLHVLCRDQLTQVQTADTCIYKIIYSGHIQSTLQYQLLPIKAPSIDI